MRNYVSKVCWNGSLLVSIDNLIIGSATVMSEKFVGSFVVSLLIMKHGQGKG
jgi:hypothetical protein